MKNVKVKFLKSPTGAYLLGYSKGEVAEFPEAQAKELIDKGFAAPADESDSALPEDFPGRQRFALLGLNTLDEIKSIPDLSELDGIGKKTIEQVKEYFERDV